MHAPFNLCALAALLCCTPAGAAAQSQTPAATATPPAAGTHTVVIDGQGYETLPNCMATAIVVGTNANLIGATVDIQLVAWNDGAPLIVPLRNVPAAGTLASAQLGDERCVTLSEAPQ